MKALTVHQPWAWAIMHAGKNIENRIRKISYRGPLLIHAGRSFEYMTFWNTPEGRNAWTEFYGSVFPSEFSFGALLGYRQLVDCKYIDQSLVKDKWAEGAYCWIFDGPPIVFETPVSFIGQPGLFDVPDELVTQQKIRNMVPWPTSS